MAADVIIVLLGVCVVSMKINNKKYFKPELVAPAGDWASLVAAVEAGADSVYFGVKGLNMREFADNFNPGILKRSWLICISAGRKGVFGS